MEQVSHQLIRRGFPSPRILLWYGALVLLFISGASIGGLFPSQLDLVLLLGLDVTGVLGLGNIGLIAMTVAFLAHRLVLLTAIILASVWLAKQRFDWAAIAALLGGIFVGAIGSLVVMIFQIVTTWRAMG